MSRKQIVIASKKTKEELKELSIQPKIIYIEFDKPSEENQYNPFLYLRFFGQRRVFSLRIRVLCFRKIEIKGRDIDKLCALMMYLVNLKDLRCFQQVFAERSNAYGSLLPKVHQVLKMESNQIEAVGISANYASGYSPSDLYILGQCTKHVRYFYSFDGSTLANALRDSIVHCFLSQVEKSMRVHKLKANISGIKNFLVEQPTVQFRYLAAHLGQEDTFSILNYWGNLRNTFQLNSSK